jgi:hypothetical protein
MDFSVVAGAHCVVVSTKNKREEVLDIGRYSQS